MQQQLEPRPDAMADHPRLHFHRLTGKRLSERIEVRAIWPDQSRKPRTKFYAPQRNLLWIDHATEWAAAQNAHGANIYFGTGTRRFEQGGADAVAYQDWVYVDADDAPTFDHLQSLTGDDAPNYLLPTGGGRGHAYWLLETPEGDKHRFTAAQRALIARHGTDPAVHDMARIMRLAGTINWPNEKKKKMGRVPEMVGAVQ